MSTAGKEPAKELEKVKKMNNNMNNQKDRERFDMIRDLKYSLYNLRKF